MKGERMRKFILILIMFCILTTVSFGQVILNKDNLQEVLESEKLIVIDFWAEWCKPCKILSPIIERLVVFNQRYNKDKIEWFKVNVDENRKFLNNFRPLRGLPVVAFYKNGEEIYRFVGLLPFLKIQDIINSLLREEVKEKKDRDKKGCEDGACVPPKE